MEPGSQLLRKMIQVRGALGGTVVALLKVTPEQATAYASTAVEVLPIPEGVDLEEGQLMRITDVTEKPPARRGQVRVRGRRPLPARPGCVHGPREHRTGRRR